MSEKPEIRWDTLETFSKKKYGFFLLIQSYYWFSFQQINPAKSTENSVLLHKKKLFCHTVVSWLVNKTKIRENYLNKKLGEN